MCYHILRAPVIRLWGGHTLRRSACVPAQQAAFFSIVASAGGFVNTFFPGFGKYFCNLGHFMGLLQIAVAKRRKNTVK